jgi:hypothetical protein
MSTSAHKLNSRYQGQAYASHGGPAYGAGYDWSQAYAAPSFAASAGPSGTRNPPSLTLHVANLSPDTTDQELRSVFSQCPGFKTLRVTSLRGSLVAFVEFIDMPSASMGMQLWQGQLLRPTDRCVSLLLLASLLVKSRSCCFLTNDARLRTPLRIEFAKPSAKQSGNMYSGQ